MVGAVAAHGYRATTVRQLSALAGVSTRTIYELFANGKRECFFSAYDEVMRHIARRVALAYASERHGERRLARALEAFVREVCDEPAAARLVLVEVSAAGPGALERMEHTHRLFEGMVDLSFRQADCGAPPPLVVKGVVAGVARVARVRLLDDRVAELPALTGELLDWVLSYRSPAAAILGSLDSGGRQVVACAPACASPGERTRILDAVTRLVGQNGYAALDPAGITTAAGVPRKRFDAHFENVEGCFFAALEHHTNHALAYAAAVGATGRDWPGGVYRALSTFCEYLARDPLFARAACVEVFALGPYGVRFRETMMAAVTESFRVSAPCSQRPSSLAAEASIGAVWGIVHHHVAHGATRWLPEIAPQLSLMALAPVLGAPAAVQVILAEHARMQTRAVPVRT